MNKFLIIMAVSSIISGLLGFYFDLGYSDVFRIIFLITADVFVVLLAGKAMFAGTKAVKKYKANRANRVRSNSTAA